MVHVQLHGALTDNFAFHGQSRHRGLGGIEHVPVQ